MHKYLEYSNLYFWDIATKRQNWEIPVLRLTLQPLSAPVFPSRLYDGIMKLCCRVHSLLQSVKRIQLIAVEITAVLRMSSLLLAAPAWGSGSRISQRLF